MAEKVAKKNIKNNNQKMWNMINSLKQLKIPRISIVFMLLMFLIIIYLNVSKMNYFFAYCLNCLLQLKRNEKLIEFAI